MQTWLSVSLVTKVHISKILLHQPSCLVLKLLVHNGIKFQAEDHALPICLWWEKSTLNSDP